MFFRDEMSVDISAVHALTESKVLLALLKTPSPTSGGGNCLTARDNSLKGNSDILFKQCDIPTVWARYVRKANAMGARFEWGLA